MALSWYTTQSGWMWQSVDGMLAEDSLRPCADHEEPRRECPACDDGPGVEEGYYLGEYDGAGYPIYEKESDVLVALVDYQTHDGGMRVERVGM